MAFKSTNLDYFVSGWGTGGTYTGVSKVQAAMRIDELRIVSFVLAYSEVLKVSRPECKVVLVEPENAPLVEKGTWASHPIQGWTPDFVPSMRPDSLVECISFSLAGILDKTLYDEMVNVSGPEAIATAKLLAAKEGMH